MAFLGRGDFPSVENENSSGIQEDGYRRGYGYHRRFYYYVPLDNTYVVMQMIITFLILIVGGIAFLATYQSTIIDPIEGTKKLFIHSHLLIIGIILISNLIVHFLSKNEPMLVKGLGMILLVSMIMMFGFLVIRLNFDSTYTKNKFGQFYTEHHLQESSDSKTKVKIGMTEMSIKTEKEYYVDECMKLYQIFKIKTCGNLGLHALLNILLIYQIVKISKIRRKKEKLNKDDLILFDEEQNIRI